MRNFLITSIAGRCGTKFLSGCMNKSKLWSVMHQPNTNRASMDANIKNLPLIKSRFCQDYYGEVNSYLRFFTSMIKVEKYGFIIRNPYDIFLSAMNRGKGFTKAITIIKAGYSLIPAESKNTKLILFPLMISDKDYLESILHWFNIYDIDMNEIDLNIKVNATKTIGIKLSSFPSVPLTKEFEIYEHYKKTLPDLR